MIENNGEWIEGVPTHGQKYKKVIGNTYFISYFCDDDHLNTIKERQWRDAELSRTDKLVKLPDYPVDLLPYRALLRDYPQQPDFPNGTRPTM